MKFDVDDKNRCRLVCLKFHLNQCRFAVAVAKCLGDSLFWGHSVYYLLVYIVCLPTYLFLPFPYLFPSLLFFSFENRPASFPGRDEHVTGWANLSVHVPNLS